MLRLSHLLMILALCFGSTTMAGCWLDGDWGGPHVKPSGRIESRVYSFDNFSFIEAGSAIEIQLKKGEKYSVRFEADDNLYQYLQIKQDMERLSMTLKARASNAQLRAVITMPTLSGLELTGAVRVISDEFSCTQALKFRLSGASSVQGNFAGPEANIEMSGASRFEGKLRMTQKLRFDLSGSSRLKGILNAKQLEGDLSGASRARLSGCATSIKFEGSGASRFDARSLCSDQAEIELSGASYVSLNVKKTLSVDLSGASKVDLHGPATLTSAKISGGSRVERLSAKKP